VRTIHNPPGERLREIIWGTLPFVALMIIAVIVLCILPGIATVLPDYVMGREAMR
jgi:TRAP-type mannitol/chloroaromatic compound transport system permease large subunit